MDEPLVGRGDAIRCPHFVEDTTYVVLHVRRAAEFLNDLDDAVHRLPHRVVAGCP